MTPPAPARRPLSRRFVQLLRRGHLYAGLMLLPWVILYGITAFLFNHPTAFSDQPTASFGREALIGTPMENPPSPDAVAAQVVTALRSRAKEGDSYALAEPIAAAWTREFAFATAKTADREVSVLIDVTGTGGTARSKSIAPKADEKPAPFAVGRGGSPAVRTAPHAHNAFAIDDPFHERVKAALPSVLERVGMGGGDIALTSVPDLTFRMSDGEKVWRVTYNAMNGTVAGKPDEEAAASELSTRRFLLRLHTAHGYPGEVNAKWAWAVIVDAMAFVMVFWGVSGILMWWQIKATRFLGALVLILSIAGAAWVGFAMHELLAAAR